MTEEKKTTEKVKEEPQAKEADLAVDKKEEKKEEVKPEAKKDVKNSNGKKFVKNKRKFDKKNTVKSEFDQSIIEIARVTRVMGGGKRMRFRACVAMGNKKGRIGIGLAKSADVTNAINKAANQAQKAMIDVQVLNGTIAHVVRHKLGASQILLKPAKKGTGIICGGVVRIIMELAGIHDVTGKILGTNNKVSNAKCVIEALQSLQHIKEKKVVDKINNKKTEIKEEVKKETKKVVEKKITKKDIKK